jgi:hypothetical protein
MIYAAIFAAAALCSIVLTILVGAAGALTLFTLVFLFTLSCGFAFAASVAALISIWKERR